MKALVFVGPNKIELVEKPIPTPGPTDALIKITTTTICGTDVHILKGEYPVKPGLTIGHEPVGVVVELGSAVSGYQVGQRVIAGAITPCGQCGSCLEGVQAQCGGKPMGGWRFGNTIDGAQAEFLLVPNAMANLAPVPDSLGFAAGQLRHGWVPAEGVHDFRSGFQVVHAPSIIQLNWTYKMQKA